MPEHLFVCLTSLRITYLIILFLILWRFCVDPQKRKACRRRLRFTEHVNCSIRHSIHSSSGKSRNSCARLEAFSPFYRRTHEALRGVE